MVEHVLRPRVQKKASVKLLEALAKERLAELIKSVDERYEIAERLYQSQDQPTREAVERMADMISQISPTRIWVAKTRTGPRIAIDIPEDTHRKLSVYTAVEAVKDLGLMDIRVANFTFNGSCVECGTPVKLKKKRKK